MRISMQRRIGFFRSLLVFALLVGMVAALGAPGAMAAPARQAAGPQTWTVLVGAETEMEQTDMGPAGAWQLMRFYPDKITINEGDTIVWKTNAGEIHNVTFPPPGQNFVPFITPQPGPPPAVIVNPSAIAPVGGPTYDGTALATSGLLGKEAPGVPEYKLTFTKAGTYNYLCTIHSSQLPNGQVVGMTASVTVQAAGSALAKTPDQVSADAQAAIAADSQAAAANDAQAKQVKPAEQGPNGTMMYHINMGFDTETAAYMRFSPSDLTIHVGDTVQWTQNSAVTPHTVTITSGGKEPDLISVVQQPSGPPTFMLNPDILAPAGGPNYAGTGYFNSGFMNGTQDPAPGPRTYNLTFTTPGTYEYICALHDTMGMSGHITVLAAGAVPGMPVTGGASGQPDTLPVVAGLAALALALGGLALKRRSAHSRA